MLAYPIELAKQIQVIDRIIVTTDHPEIKRIALQYGAEVPFTRPAKISEDVPSELVTEHALIYLRDKEQYHADIAVTLTPCHPFTKPEQLKDGINLLLENPEWDSVVTVKKVTEYPQWMVDYKPGKPCKTILGNPLDGDFNVSQKMDQYYYLYGAYFINRVDPFLKKPSMYGEKWGAVFFESKYHIDVDTPKDLKKAQLIAKKIGLH